MKKVKLNLAIIGQGRSGRDIHGAYLISDKNIHYNVKYVVDFDPVRLKEAKERYKGCETFSDYTELFGKKDIDLVVNASYSDMHYSITKELLEHGKNVLVEKPFARTRLECEILINTAKKNNVLLAVFQNTARSPYYEHILQLIKDKTLGSIECVNLRYNSLSRRWDWQTSLKNVGGIVYNMGPHIVGIAMGILGFSDDIEMVYSKIKNTHSSGDAEDFAKIILTAPGQPVVDIEMNSTDAYCDYNVKLQGSRGTYIGTTANYKYKYYIDEENEPKTYIADSLKDENCSPAACIEKLKFHEKSGVYDGTAFDIGTRNIYDDVYYAITEKKPLVVAPESVAKLIGILELVHAQNHLPIKIF